MSAVTKIDEIPEDTAALRAALAEIAENLAERDRVLAERNARIGRLRHQSEVLEKIATARPA